MAEAVLNHLGQGRFIGYSAGSHPQADLQPHPLALEVLNKSGISITNLRSKSWHEFAKSDAPEMDLVISLCDALQEEPCPSWPGQPVAAHWSYPDPTLLTGTEQSKLDGFRIILLGILRRVGALINIPVEKISKLHLQTSAQQIELEYAELDALRERVEKLKGTARKADLIRAGINTLAKMPDSELVAAIESVPLPQKTAQWH
jgi:protein-tyrosine-phosphatase